MPKGFSKAMNIGMYGGTYSQQSSPRWGGGTVSKLAPDFIPKTLSRLLPSPNEIRRMGKEELVKLIGLKEKLTALIKADPTRFFLPSPGGQREFCDCNDPNTRIYAYLAGNKSGKSTAGAIKFCERLLGRSLWEREGRNFKFPTPARGCVFAEDFDSHKEVTWPTLITWLPKGTISRVIRNGAGQITEASLSNGSLIHFRTYDQGSDKAEGKDWNIVWLDEPPPRSIYTAVFRGLVSTNGYMLITATLLKEAWLFDEMDHPYVKVFQGTIHDNTYISQQAKEDFLNSLDESERQVRETGKPAMLTGLVYKEFHDGPPFVVEPHPFNKDYPIIMGVDPHERRPVYVLYGYIDPNDRVTWFEKVFVSGSLTDIFEKLSIVEQTLPSKPAICIMDPNRGRARQLGGKSWEDEFVNHNYNVMLGFDDLRIGHACMREYLRGPEPLMRWTANLRGKGGPIYQMMRYSWDDWVHNRRYNEKSLKEKPREQHKDFPDIHRYTAAAELKFDILSKGYDVIDRMPAGYRQTREGMLRAYY